MTANTDTTYREAPFVYPCFVHRNGRTEPLIWESMNSPIPCIRTKGIGVLHTVRHAAELNHEVTVQQVQRSTGAEVDSTATAAPARPATGAWIGLDSEHVILDTVKMAEDGHGTVLRFYESSGKRERVTLQWPHAFEQAYLSNALEEPGEPLDMTNGQITLTFAPYEIKTVLLR